MDSQSDAALATPAESRPAWTLSDLVVWWEERFAHRFESRRAILGRLRRHLLAQLGELACEDLTADVLELHLAGRAERLGAEALNHIRSDLRRCIRAAKGSRRWPWDDPTDFVRPRRVPARAWRVLSLDECRALLWGASVQHLGLFAVAIYAGLRKGELVALRREDVDLSARRIYVRRSRRRDTTKTGRARIVPISDELVRYLDRQLRMSLGEWVFPGADGRGPRTPDANLGRAVRSALKRGGADVPSVRFQDLRHTCATLLRRAGVDRDLVAAVLGHTSKSATVLYSHFTEGDLLDAVNKLALGAPARKEQSDGR